MNVNNNSAGMTRYNSAGTLDEIKEAIIALHRPGPDDVIELRIPKVNRRKNNTVSGYFDGDHLDDLARAALAYDGKAAGVYVTLNPCKESLLARCANRAEEYAELTTSDTGIARRTNLLIDADPRRAAGISSTDEEKSAAMALLQSVREWLDLQGWQAPRLVADSGNGGHLIYALDLLNDEDSTRLIARVLKAIAQQFDTEQVSIDTSVYNAARICKLYGSLSAKGDHMPQRPHRRARILERNPTPVPVEVALLQRVVSFEDDGQKKATGKTKTSRSIQSVAGQPQPQAQWDRAAWIRDWCSQHEVRIAGEKMNEERLILRLEVCPFHSDHASPDSALIIERSGSIGFHCFHNSCRNYSWRDVRDKVESDTRSHVAAITEQSQDAPPGAQPVSAVAEQDAVAHVLALLESITDRAQVEERLLDDDVLEVASRMSRTDRLKLQTRLNQKGITARFLGAWQSAIHDRKSASSPQQLAPMPFLSLPDHDDQMLYLPSGYQLHGESIVQISSRGDIYDVYDGRLAVIATGRDLLSGANTLTVLFETQSGDAILTAPRESFAQARVCLPLMAQQGAAIYDSNARHLTRYLSKFVTENRHVIPFRANADRLGIIREGLVLPGWSLGFAEDVEYVGPPVRVGDDGALFDSTLRDILLWEQSEVALLAIGFALASPLIARLNMHRQPVVMIHGPSNCGKTTLLQFAVAVWGDPTRSPFRIDGSNTTAVGLSQSLSSVRGLSLLVDEIHQVSDQKQVETLIYAFANGQGRVMGAPDGIAQAGDPLRGTLLLSGEILPEFQHMGSSNRVFSIDAAVYPPLGVPARTQAGRARAEHLKDAWTRGCGTLGPRVATRLWQDWDTVKARHHDLAQHSSVQPLSLWGDVLSAAMVALELAAEEVGASLSDEQISKLLQTWTAMLLSGRQERDPAIDAFERLLGMLARGQRRGMDEHGLEVPLFVFSDETKDMTRNSRLRWETIHLHNQPIAYKKEGEDYWRIPTQTPQFRDSVGTHVMQQFGQLWGAKGLIRLSGKAQSATGKVRIPVGGTQPCVLLPETQM